MGGTPSVPVAEGIAAASAGGRVKVNTPEFEMEINTRGGTITSVFLQHYPKQIDRPEVKLSLFEPAPPRLYIAQSGLIGAGPDLAPTHETVFTAEQTEYVMADGQDSLRVTLTWAHPSGVEVRKHFGFTRGSYVVTVDQEVVNGAGEAWSGRRYGQLQRMEVAEEGQSSFMYTYLGGAYYTPEDKYRKYTFEDMVEAPLAVDASEGWVSMLQHYFVSAWIPPAEETDHFYSKVLSGGRYVIGSYSPTVSVPPGGNHVFSSKLYVGPKLQTELEKVAPGLDLTRDYGWLAVIAQPMFWIIQQIHKLVGNWGWAIIIFTILL